MVSAGTLSIAGTIETSEIDRGLDRIEDGLQNTKAQANSTFGSFSNLSQVTSTVAGHMMTLASVGVGAMTAMATISPQVAPAMARIGNEMRKISFALGDTLRPMFESVANDLIPAIGSAIDRFTPQIQAMVTTGTQGIQDISNVLSGQWSQIENIIPKGAGVATGIAIGKNFGLQGMLLGAALGYIAGDKLTPETSEEMQTKYGPYAETMQSSRETWQNTQDIMGEGFGSRSFFGQTLPATGALLAGGFRTGTNAIFDTVEWIFQGLSNKYRDFSGEERT